MADESERVAANMRALRKARRWSAHRLADEMTRVRVRWDRSTVANFENRRRQTLSVDELAALGVVFNVEPWSLTGSTVDCRCCHGSPPEGYVCMTCGADGGLLKQPAESHGERFGGPGMPESPHEARRGDPGGPQ